MISTAVKQNQHFIVQVNSSTIVDGHSIDEKKDIENGLPSSTIPIIPLLEIEAYEEGFELYPYCFPFRIPGIFPQLLRAFAVNPIYNDGFTNNFQDFLVEGEADLRPIEMIAVGNEFVTKEELRKNCILPKNTDEWIDSSIEFWQMSINDHRVWNNETNLSMLHTKEKNTLLGELICENRWLRMNSTNELPMRYGFNFLDLIIFLSVIIIQTFGFLAYIYTFDSSCQQQHTTRDWKTFFSVIFCMFYLSILLSSDMHRKTIRFLHDFSIFNMKYSLSLIKMIKQNISNRKFLTVLADIYTQIFGIIASVYTISNITSPRDLLFNFTIMGTLMSLDNVMCLLLYLPDVRRTLKYKNPKIHRATRFSLEHSLNQTKSIYLIVLILIQCIFLGFSCGIF